MCAESGAESAEIQAGKQSKNWRTVGSESEGHGGEGKREYKEHYNQVSGVGVYPQGSTDGC